MIMVTTTGGRKLQQQPAGRIRFFAKRLGEPPRNHVDETQ